MQVYDLIVKTRNGHGLSKSEINYLIDNYTRGNIPDYQMAAWCMAIFFQGMKPAEVTDLTMAMANSGVSYDLRSINGTKIDKHSTGGVGDTTTLIVAPLVASCNIPVAKMSGKGLGHTGGTLDKLASIPGFNYELTQEQFIKQVNQIKLALIGQTSQVAPADKKLYGLRDVTATVDSLPLIASSIMSKKLATGADGFVLDVKAGSGGFMKNVSEAIELAKIMVTIGKHTHKPTVALVTNMDQPLGYMIGNALEIKEAILTLAGEGPEDLQELCLELASEMLILAGYSQDYSQARQVLLKKFKSKEALAKLGEMIAFQGGDARVIQDFSLLPVAPVKGEVLSSNSGFVNHVDALALGKVTMMLGAGRETQESKIDLGVGIELKKKVGDFVKEKEVLAVVHSNAKNQAVEEQVLNAFNIKPTAPADICLVYKKITG